MNRMRLTANRLLRRVAMASALAACLPVAALASPPHWSPGPGLRHYRYDSVERAPGQPDKAYRVDFDLAADAHGGIVAIVRHAARGAGGAWTETALDADCRAALRARPGELARVTLAPLAPESAATLGDAFMAGCAPAELFFPMTDILNVALVQSSPHFGLASLASPGDSRHFTGFDTRLDRLGVGIDAASPGGTTRFAARSGGRLYVDWVPDPMRIAILHHGALNGQDLHLAGVENFAFRLIIDAPTGALVSAATPYDRLDLIVQLPGMPPESAPRMTITREVTITPTEG
jgi:hypothetical protein